MKTIQELQDFRGTLKELNSIIQNMILNHGETTIVYFDAGNNNVDVIIEEI